jgi:glycosyltransferase involved in cell wall biosynthesis
MEEVGRRSVLLLAGRDAGAAPVRALADEIGVGRDVRLLGEVADVAGLYGASDLAVFSSKSEGCPNAVLEAMAAGLPVVASDIAGVREALGRAAGDCLVPTSDAEAFAERILAVAADPARRASAGQANRERALSEFALDAMLHRMTAIVAQALAARRAVCTESPQRNLRARLEASHE